MTTDIKKPAYKIDYQGRDIPTTIGIDPDAKKDMPKIAKVVAQEANDLGQIYGFDQVIKGPEGPFRPHDGAAAFARAIKRVFDTEGVGKEIRSMFGSTPPLFIDVQVQTLIYRTGDGRAITEENLLDQRAWPIQDLVSYALSEGVNVPSPYGERDRAWIVPDLLKQWTVVSTDIHTVNVPWGKVEIPGTSIEVYLTEDEDPSFGAVFRMAVQATKLERGLVDLLRDSVLEELTQRSIYKGRCLYTSSKNEAPTFWCPFKATRAEELILPADLQYRLDKEIYSILRNIEKCRKLDRALLTRSFLFEGDYGTGKTQATNIVAQVAMQHGVTVIRHRPGAGSLDDTQAMAALHSPSVIQVEDVESFMPVREGMDKQTYRTEISKVLEAFDGALTKGREVLTVMTTNDADAVAAGMTRAGRTDGLFHFHSLDRDGLERLVRLKLGRYLQDDINFDAVWAVSSDMSSAFLAEIVKRSQSYLLDDDDARLATDDLVGIVMGLRAHYDWHLRVKQMDEGTPEPSMREYLSEITSTQAERAVEKVLTSGYAFDTSSGGPTYPLVRIDK